MGKGTRRPQAAKYSPAKRGIQRPDEGIGPYKKALYHCPLIRPLRGHLPPEGKALGGDRLLIRHGFAVPPSPQGKAFKGSPLIHLA